MPLALSSGIEGSVHQSSIKRRRRQRHDDGIQRRVDRARLVRLGELLSAVPGFGWTNLARRPPVPRHELSQEIMRSEPAEAFELDVDALLVFENSQEGCSPRFIWYDSRSLVPILESEADSELLVLAIQPPHHQPMASWPRLEGTVEELPRSKFSLCSNSSSEHTDLQPMIHITRNKRIRRINPRRHAWGHRGRPIPAHLADCHWTLCPRVKPRPGLHTTTRELQTCTFERPGASKHHQNSTRRPPERQKE